MTFALNGLTVSVSTTLGGLWHGLLKLWSLCPSPTWQQLPGKVDIMMTNRCILDKFKRFVQAQKLYSQWWTSLASDSIVSLAGGLQCCTFNISCVPKVQEAKVSAKSPKPKAKSKKQKLACQSAGFSHCGETLLRARKRGETAMTVPGLIGAVGHSHPQVENIMRGGMCNQLHGRTVCIQYDTLKG